MSTPVQHDRPLLRRGDEGYNSARAVFNAMIDRYPDQILRCFDSADVVAGVTLARRQALPLSVKAGGHSVAGTAVCDGGMLLDLSGLKGVAVDPTGRTVRAQGGVTLGELDACTAAHGLATPTGIVSVTGLAGLALGGGLGWMNGGYGLSCDNFVSVEIVTADGELLTASELQHPDLFWAIRGGGGNFGVVTAFTMQLHPLDTVLVGGLSFSSTKAHAALAAYHELASGCPDEFTVNASVGRDSAGKVIVGVGFCHLDLAADVDDLLRRLRAVGPANEEVTLIRFVDLQKASDEGFPEHRQHYWKSGSITELNDDAIDTILEHVGRMPSGTSGVGLQQLHGAAARVAPTATAYPHRNDRYDFLVLSQWPDPADNDINLAWTSEFFAAMTPHLDASVYVNNLGDEGIHRVRQAYGPNYERLARIKAIYDPTNLFRHNHNIPPQPMTVTA